MVTLHDALMRAIEGKLTSETVSRIIWKEQPLPPLLTISAAAISHWSPKNHVTNSILQALYIVNLIADDKCARGLFFLPTRTDRIQAEDTFNLNCHNRSAVKKRVKSAIRHAAKLTKLSKPHA